jgi:hypothetical protein
MVFALRCMAQIFVISRNGQELFFAGFFEQTAELPNVRLTVPP